MEAFFYGIIVILTLVGIGKAIYDWFREPSEDNGNETYVSPFYEWTEYKDDGDRIIHFSCPNPAKGNLPLIREFLDHEDSMLKIEHYLKLAKEMNAPEVVIYLIEEKIRLDRELRQRIIDQEMEELDRQIEREVREMMR